MKHLMGGVSWLPFFAAEAEAGAAEAGGEGGTPTPKLGEGTPTPEEPVVEAAAEEEAEAEPDKKPWYTKRFDELTGKWRDEERQHAQTKTELALAKAEAEALRKGGKAEGEEKPAPAAAAPDPNLVPRSEVSRLAKEEANRLAAEADFNKSCNEVFAKGKAEFKDFDKKVGAFGQLTSGHTDPVAFGNYMNLVSASLELGDDSAKVLYALGSDMDEAARVMSLPPIKMGVELTRIASRLNTGKPISSAPAPIRPVRGAAKAEPRLDDPNLSTAEWVALRNKQLAEKRASGG
jgi:hypothetical protein